MKRGQFMIFVISKICHCHFLLCDMRNYFMLNNWILFGELFLDFRCHVICKNLFFPYFYNCLLKICKFPGNQKSEKVSLLVVLVMAHCLQIFFDLISSTNVLYLSHNFDIFWFFADQFHTRIAEPCRTGQFGLYRTGLAANLHTLVPKISSPIWKIKQ